MLICNPSGTVRWGIFLPVLSVTALSRSEYKVGELGHQSVLWKLINGDASNLAFALAPRT